MLSLFLMFSLSLTAFASSNNNPVAQAINGTVAIYSDILLSDGTDASCFGSGFGVGVNGENATYFITNRHVITASNDDGSLTQAQHVLCWGKMPSHRPFIWLSWTGNTFPSAITSI